MNVSLCSVCAKYFVQVIQAKVKENYNLEMWIKQCDKRVQSCFVAQGDYDNQLPTFRGCAGVIYPHDQKCETEKQVSNSNDEFQQNKTRHLQY